jgi:hypothetical protein
LLELLEEDLVLFIEKSIIPLLEGLCHDQLLLDELLLVPDNVLMMKLLPFLFGVSDAIEQLIVRLLLEFKLRQQFLVHQGVISDLLLYLLISHVVKLQLV